MDRLACIGFGEAAIAFVDDGPRHPAVRAYDIKTCLPQGAAAKLQEMARAGVEPASSMGEALAGASAVLSLVTADQALTAAAEGAAHVARGALWFDMNSVAPDTKRQAAALIDGAGGRYVDVAVMAPVHPAKAAVPLLVSGPHAVAAVEGLREIGFSKVRVAPGDVGRASSIKMIRSVMVKGIEALTAECVLAAYRADVLDEVLASLDASPPKGGWRGRADYNLGRMMEHGMRRAAEMEEVVKTLEALGAGSAMSRCTMEEQRRIGALELAPRGGLEDKIAALSLPSSQDEAA